MAPSHLSKIIKQVYENVAVAYGKADPEIDILENTYDPLEDSDASEAPSDHEGEDIIIFKKKDPKEKLEPVEWSTDDEELGDDESMALGSESDFAQDDDDLEDDNQHPTNKNNMQDDDGKINSEQLQKLHLIDEFVKANGLDDNPENNNKRSVENCSAEGKAVAKKPKVMDESIKCRGHPTSARKQIDVHVRTRFETFIHKMEALQDATRDDPRFSFGAVCYLEQNPNAGNKAGKALVVPEYHFLTDGVASAKRIEELFPSTDDYATIVNSKSKKYLSDLFKKNRR